MQSNVAIDLAKIFYFQFRNLHLKLLHIQVRRLLLNNLIQRPKPKIVSVWPTITLFMSATKFSNVLEFPRRGLVASCSN